MPSQRVRPEHPTDPEDPTDPHRLTRRRFLIGGAATGLGIAAYAATHGRHILEISHHTIAIRNLPDAFQNFRIVQLSDIHLKEFTEPYFLAEAVQHINALAPELVLITGDFISRAPRANDFALQTAGLCAEILSGLRTPQRYAILGNHDALVGAQPIIDRLHDHGTPVLVDSYLPIERGHDRLWLAGAQDPGVLGCNLDRAIPKSPGAPVIFMCHEPDFADKVLQHPSHHHIDLMLSGHTHGGQIRLPILGPLILPAMGTKYVQGLFQMENMQLFVNRGLGTVGMPFRLNCPAEITEITLQRA